MVKLKEVTGIDKFLGCFGFIVCTLFALIESGEKEIGIHLDDCAMVEPGVLIVGDGFRFIKDPKFSK